MTSAVWLALGAMLLLGLVDLVYKRGVAEYERGLGHGDLRPVARRLRTQHPLVAVVGRP